jgi:hypothetical protein
VSEQEAIEILKVCKPIAERIEADPERRAGLTDEETELHQDFDRVFQANGGSWTDKLDKLAKAAGLTGRQIHWLIMANGVVRRANSSLTEDFQA